MKTAQNEIPPPGIDAARVAIRDWIVLNGGAPAHLTVPAAMRHVLHHHLGLSRREADIVQNRLSSQSVPATVEGITVQVANEIDRLDR